MQTIEAKREGKALNQSRYKRRRRHKERMDETFDLGPEATWNWNAHGFKMVGYPVPCEIRDYERFMAAITQFWANRGQTEPLVSITWDYVWLDWVNGQR